MSGRTWLRWVVLAALGLACRGDPQEPPSGTVRQPLGEGAAASLDRQHEASPPAATAKISTKYPAARRVVAFADVHGDLRATRAALRLAGAVDRSDRWVGADLVVVQTGDQLDRGEDEQAILELFERLTDEAARAGGAFHALNGNHEVMNVAGDLRYVTPAGFADFDDVALGDLEPRLGDVPEAKRSRVAAFAPGGPYARLLAHRNTILIVGDTVFVHAGVRPEHVDVGIELINERIRAWMRGENDREIVELAMSPESPVWTRVYSAPPVDCALLERTLSALAAARMVVGHTPQEQGINSACNGKVWRIDSGMSAHYGGPVQVLEIAGDEVRVLHTMSR